MLSGSSLTCVQSKGLTLEELGLKFDDAVALRFEDAFQEKVGMRSESADMGVTKVDAATKAETTSGV